MTRHGGFFLALAFCAGGALAGPMRVQVQSTPLRATPAFLSKPVTTLVYEQAVEAVGTQGAWSQVRTESGQAGWVHQSAIAPQRAAWRPGAATGTSGASSDEMALASKGFSAQVEKEFRNKHANVDFTWVDAMSAIRIESSDIVRFVSEGGLNPADGSRP